MERTNLCSTKVAAACIGRPLTQNPTPFNPIALAPIPPVTGRNLIFVKVLIIRPNRLDREPTKEERFSLYPKSIEFVGSLQNRRFW